MRKQLPILLAVAAWPLFGQLESHTLSVSATRQISPQPDQVVFYLTVNSTPTATLDQIVAALAGLNVTSEDFSGTENSANPPSLEWYFSMAVPLSSLPATIGSIAKLQQTITQNDSGLSLTFSLGGTQVSAQLQQSQSCSTSDLIADAKTQARNLAAAAGMGLGPILRLSNFPTYQPLLMPTEFRAVFVTGALSNFLLGTPPTPVTCSLTVVFQLRP